MLCGGSDGGGIAVAVAAQARAAWLQELKARDLQALRGPRDAVPRPVVLSAARRWWGHRDLRLQLLVGGVTVLILGGALVASDATLIQALANGKRPHSTTSFGADLGLTLALLGLAVVPVPLLIALRYKPIARRNSSSTAKQVLAGIGLVTLEMTGLLIAANGFVLHREPTMIARTFADIGVGVGVVLMVELQLLAAWNRICGRP